eukprot:CAMPEP_0206464628 /NCGR_PEP_ID=MMETSP0324_2-20121206/27330_1 /ASSEMBLY_ACC=CAM_ASM_000836 /TAXON_ID=2866 /ORGANISM="Crypthecodinium cohnii, Strain Seligo" /LENGTH=31 /DNA_ID= /DNA_START= /DNA_END= /DNA_ORIENTATION=
MARLWAQAVARGCTPYPKPETSDPLWQEADR